MRIGFFVVVLAASAAHAESYAILPARGDAFPPVLQEIDRQARKALVESGVEVQAQDVTDKQLSDLFASGVVCDVGADDCALRIALAAGVDVVMSDSVSIVGSRLLLRASAVSTAPDAKPRHVFGELVLPSKDAGASVASVVKRALGKTAPATPVPLTAKVTPESALVVVDKSAAPVEDGHLWLKPGPHHVEVRAAGYRTLSVDLSVADDTLDTVTWALTSGTSSTEPLAQDNATTTTPAAAPLAISPGIILAAAGGAVAVVGFVGAGVAEASLGQPLKPADRDATHTTGLVFLVAGVVGGLAAAGGGVWAAVQ
jgi:hypothetical protein